jgi:hypothetical protein
MIVADVGRCPRLVLMLKLQLSWAECLLRRFAPDFPAHRFPTIESLSFAAISAFDARILAQQSHGLGVGAQQRTVEAQYQDEFYRACTEVLGRTYLRSEWSDQSMGSKGRVDFYIPDVRWAIEL